MISTDYMISYFGFNFDRKSTDFQSITSSDNHLFLVMSSFHGVKPGQPPLGVSKPGSRDGGALPDDFSNPSLGLALALVPPGTSPVAAFPPFVKSRHSTRVKCFKLGLFKNLQPAKSQSDYGGGILIFILQY